MREMMTRRALLVSLGAVAVAALPWQRSDVAAGEDHLIALFAAIEQRLGGRLGVMVIDTGTGSRWGHREDERFPMCSSFKAIAGAAVLARVDRGEDTLARRVRFSAADLVPYSPVTESRVGGEGMTLGELCEATITTSDNTAGNLVLAAIGGPEGFTDFVRTLGDAVTRLDRWEPKLNESRPGELRDTTSPAAMAGLLQALLFGKALAPASRQQLADWMIANKTGDARLRAGFPKGWTVGDKTGTCGRGILNDIAVVWPPDGAPLIVSVYIAEASAANAESEAAMAEIARAVTAAIAG